MREDVELLEAWRAGDADAGEELLARHFELVFRYFDRRVGADADDLTQRTFLGLVEARERFRGQCPFRAFVLSIARNQLLQAFERKRKESAVSFQTMSLVDLGRGATTEMFADQRRQRLHEALRSLPIDLHTAVELYYFEDMGIKDIAVVLEAPEGTVKRWLWRARALLAERLPEELRDVVAEQLPEREELAERGRG